jgi:hypothetical protein
MELGIGALPNSWNREQILSRIQQAGFQAEFIEIEQEAPEANATAIQQLNRVAAEEGDKFIEINIHVSEAQGGDEPVYVSCNGRGCRLPRGENIVIPERLYESLKNAVADVYDPLKDGGISTTPRKVPRFPHMVLRRNVPASESSMKAAA